LLHLGHEIETLDQIVRDPPRIEMRRHQAMIMSKIMRNYCLNYNDELKKKDPKRFETLVNILWRDLMADYQYVLDPLSFELNNCTIDCFNQKTMTCISSELRLYGCWIHGHVHHCKGKHESCRMVYITHDLQEICIFSGVSLGYTSIANADATYKTGFGSSGFERHKYNLCREDMESKRRGFCIRPNLPSKPHGDNDATENEVNRRKRIYEMMEDDLQKDINAQSHTISSSLQRIVPSKTSYSSMPDAKRSCVREEKQKSPAKATANGALSAALASAAPPPPKIEKNKKGSPAVVNASNVSAQRVDRLRRTAIATAKVTIENVFFDLLDSEGRRLYNQYSEGEHEWKLKTTMDNYFKSVQRQKTLPNAMHMTTLVANVNNSLEILIVDVDRPSQIIGRYAQIIMSLWNLCFSSPYAKSQIEMARQSPVQERRRSRSSSPATYRFTPTPINSGLCTLRQFALAIIYSLRDGFSVRINDSFALGSIGQSMTVVAPNEKLSALLPPRSKIHFFGDVARRALRSRIVQNVFGPSRFDPLENLQENQTSADARSSSVDTLRLLGKGSQRNYSIENTSDALSIFGEGASDQSGRSSISSKSKSISSSLINHQRSSIRRKSRNRKKILAPVIEGVKETRNYSISGSGENGGSESMFVPCHHREPFLTNGKIVYSQYCIEEGLRMLKMSLESYGPKLNTVLQKY